MTLCAPAMYFLGGVGGGIQIFMYVQFSSVLMVWSVPLSSSQAQSWLCLAQRKDQAAGNLLMTVSFYCIIFVYPLLPREAIAPSLSSLPSQHAEWACISIQLVCWCLCVCVPALFDHLVSVSVPFPGVFMFMCVGETGLRVNMASALVCVCVCV